MYGVEGLQAMWSSACDAWAAMYERGGDVCAAEAKRINCPVLILHGAKDPITPVSQARWFHEMIPDASLFVFPDGKHNIHQRFAEDFNRKVEAFLEK